MVKATELVIITGMSGAGKSQANKCLEDIGFFCIDNLPTRLIPTFVRLCTQSDHAIERVALVIDVRGGEFLDPLFDILGMLRAEGHAVKIVFLDASNEVLVRRFSESRRPHPLAAGKSALAGIVAERQMLTRLLDEADLIIETSALTIHDLKRFLSQAFVVSGPQPRSASPWSLLAINMDCRLTPIWSLILDSYPALILSMTCGR
jgi:UPF0042 nucleotide-binding protein